LTIRFLPPAGYTLKRGICRVSNGLVSLKLSVRRGRSL